MKEAELAKPVAEWMRSKGYTVYAEVPCLSQCVDFVGIRDMEILCVELKLSLTRHVIRQAVTCQLVTEKVYVGVGSRPRKDSIGLCKKYGLGILSIKDGKVNCIIEPTRKYDLYDSVAKKIIDTCKMMVPGDEAGKPCQAGDGPAQDCFRRIKEYRKDHPKATWKQIYENVPNQYCSAASLAGGMRMVKQRAWLAECRKAKKADSEGMG